MASSYEHVIVPSIVGHVELIGIKIVPAEASMVIVLSALPFVISLGGPWQSSFAL